LLENLNKEWQTISTKLYQQTEGTQNTENNQEETTDVEFEEVK